MAITTLAQTVWPDTPIQRCWWHLPRALRWALYADKANRRWANEQRAELVELLHRAAREGLTVEQALAGYDAFTAGMAAHHAASELLVGARDQAFTCLRPELRARLSAIGGPEMGSGVLERVMRELNARTDIGGSRWSVAGLLELITLQLDRMTDHPAWQAVQAQTRPANTINFAIKERSSTLADATDSSVTSRAPRSPAGSTSAAKGAHGSASVRRSRQLMAIRE